MLELSRLFFIYTATTKIYTLSLHDALPIFLWEKFLFIAGIGGVTALARSAIGPLLAGAEGRALLTRSEEHTSELQSLRHLVCRLLLEKKNCEVDNAEGGQVTYHRLLVRCGS